MVDQKIDTPLLLSQRVVQVCLFLVAAIAVFGGTLQLYLGEPETTLRLDNVHRFIARVYLASGLTALWAAVNIRSQTNLIFMLALTVFFGGTGRLVSMMKVGLPEPHALWLGYLIPELAFPVIIVIAHILTIRKSI